MELFSRFEMHKLIAFVGEDDSDITPFFLDHYRRLGVGEFHVIVHGDWSDAELAPLQAADVTIEAFSQEPFGVVMKTSALQTLAERFSGEWIIVADTDEFLELPYASLARTVAALRCLGIKELPASLLQRAARDGRLLSLADGAPEALFPCYDIRLAERMGSRGPIWKGKYPLVMRRARTSSFRHGNHFPSYGRAVAHLPIHGVAHHFKWRDRLMQAIARESRRKLETSTSRTSISDGCRSTASAPADRGLKPCDRAALIEDGQLIRPNRIELRIGSALRRADVRAVGRQVDASGAEAASEGSERGGASRYLDRDRYLARSAAYSSPPGRIALVTFDLLGLRRTGGIGTAMARLAERLVAEGHEVHIFFCTTCSAFPVGIAFGRRLEGARMPSPLPSRPQDRTERLTPDERALSIASIMR